MKRKMQVAMAYLLSLILVCTSFLEFVVPVKAAETGFAENVIIVSDTAAEYCWNDTTVNLSVVVLNGTNLTWSADRTDGITITEGEDTEDRAGTAKHAAVAIDSTASGEYKITANAGNDSRTITLNVNHSLSGIQGVVVTDFNNQFTDNSFEVKAVVDPRYADTFQWGSADSTKVEVKPLEEKTDTTTYAGSVVKYAQVILKSEKPAGGTCDITATANEQVRTQTLTIYKAATNMKNLETVATSYQQKEPEFDLVTYNHMSSDTIYVDMDETITLSGIVEGTLVNPEKEIGAALSRADVDDGIGVSSTEQDSGGNFSWGSGSYEKLSDTSYRFEVKVTGIKATSITNPLDISIFTDSGKAIKRKLVVLAPAQDMTFIKNNELVVLPNTSVGLCYESDLSSFNLKNYNVLGTYDEKTDLYTQNEKNRAGGGSEIVAGDTIDLAPIFRSRFDTATKKYICDSTDTALWVSEDETIATVTQDGIIKGVKGGNTTIYCYASPTKTSSRKDIYAVYYVQVTDLILADRINITKNINGEQKVIVEDTIYTSQKDIQYSAQLVDGNQTANERVTWASSDESVFTVNAATGVVNPVAAGTANLVATAVSSGIQAFIPIKVIAAVETVKIVELKTTTNYVQGHTYTLTTNINEGADENEALTWTVENTDENDPVVVFIDPNDSEKKELTKFVGRTVNIKLKKRGSATVTVKGAYNTSAIDNCIITGISERTAVNTYIMYNGEDCAGKELTVNKGTNVELKASLLDENKIESTDDFEWNIVQKGEIVKATNSSLMNEKNLTLQPLTKGDVTIELRNLQTNKLLTVTLHVKVPATAISLKESEAEEIMLVPGEAGTTGTTYQLKPILTPEDTSDIVTYESSDDSIVKVDENGLITAVKSSETPVTITAKINDTLKASCQVRVAIPVEEMSAEDSNGNIIENDGVVRVYKDETGEIKLNCGNATEYINWTTQNERIASLKPSNDTYTCTINGNVAGQTTITATTSISKKKMQFTVKVVNRIQQMNLTGSTQVALNATNGYVSVTLPANSDEVVWTVDHPEIVELTPSRSNTVARAAIKPLKVGKVIITATSADGLCSASKEIEITALNLSSAGIAAIEPMVYDGAEQKPKLTVTFNNKELKEGEDYQVTYSNNINVGYATATITGGTNANYAGTKSVRFNIIQREIENAQAARVNNVQYTGNNVTPEVKVTDLGKVLVKDTDYTLSYSNNRNAGTATVTIKGKNNYKGTKTINFAITPLSVSRVKVAKITNQAYTGTAKKPSISVKNGTVNLGLNRDYTVAYSANKYPGKAKIIIKGIGNYTGIKTVYFYIAPSSMKVSYAKRTSAKSMKMKWKRDKRVTGYQIYYATNSKFKSKKTVTLTKNKYTSKTIKNLKSTKTYYVKIRSYKKAGSKKIYSPWSSVYQINPK